VTVSLALSWTPTTNHVGFFVALSRGWYAERGLSVLLRSSRRQRDYASEPVRRVADGDDDLGVAPAGRLVEHALRRGPDDPELVAVSTIPQRGTTAIVSLADGPVQRPRDLDGRTYASYGARYEDALVRELIESDGGRGEFESVHPEMMDVPGVLLSGEADATWVLWPWEGVLCEHGGVELNRFGLEEYGVPYGYPAVVFTRRDTLDQRGETVRSFLAAAAAGYRVVGTDPDGAVREFATLADGPHLDDLGFLQAAARSMAPALLDEAGRWGRMRHDRWADFLDWLAERSAFADGVDPAAVDAEDLYTNDYLPEHPESGPDPPRTAARRDSDPDDAPT
jgi:NitT/TauT family transport system substrate-binding protein